jgi:hypothetical protein
MVPEAPARAGGRATESLNAKLHGHYQYYGRPTNYRSLQQFYRSVRRIWKQGLSRRTRGRWLTWNRYMEILRQHPLLLPGSCTLGERGVLLEEPAAGNLHGGVCAGGRPRWAMVDLNAHEAGNGGKKPREAYSLPSLLYSEDLGGRHLLWCDESEDKNVMKCCDFAPAV